MKKTLSRALALVLVLTLMLPCIAIFNKPVEVSAAEYRVAYQNGPSSSYKSSKYYQHFLKVPLTGDGRTDTVALALSQMGYHEGASTSDMSGSSSSNGNFTEYNWNLGAFMTGGYNYEWCATFCSWALFQAKQTAHGTGTKDLCRYHKGDATYVWREVGCSPWVYNLNKAGYWKYSKYAGGTYAPQPGDLIFFRSAAHIGMVVYSDSNYVYTIEGNTSDASGVEPAGGGVFFKSYALNSSAIDGYGVLPYKKNASAPTVDYSGANPTAGLWITNAKKDIYTDASCTVATGTVIPRFTMIEATSVAPNKKAIKVTYNGVTGYVALNSYRVVQISSSSSIDPAVQAARDKLQALVDTVSGISYKDYTDDRLATLRSKYYDAQVVLVNEDATAAQYESAYNALNTAYNNKSPNPVTRGIYINNINTRVTNGKAIIFTSKFGTVTTENASHSWTANIRAKWDDSINGYLAIGTTDGVGPENTPSVTLADDEILIAVHNWEKEGDTYISASENPVPGSYDNWLNAWIPEYGGYKINFNGINLQTGVADIGAYISFEKVDATPGVGVGTNVAFKKSYTTTGLYAENGTVLWPDENGVTMTDGFVAHSDAGYDNVDFAGFNANSDEYIRDGYASITVDLGENHELNRFIAHVATKYNADAGIYAPQTVEFYVSNDKSYWHKVGAVNPVDTDMTSTTLADLQLDTPVYGRYVQYRIVASASWIFIPEVEAYGVTSSNIVDYNPATPKPPVDPDVPVDPPVDPDVPVDPPVDPDVPVEPDVPDFVKGDINESGAIDSMDYVLLKRAYFGTYKLDDIAVGDIDESGKIESMDYIYLRRAYFGTYVIK